MPITKERLEEIETAMNRRNHADLLNAEGLRMLHLELCDYVPELLSEVRRLSGLENEDWRKGEHCACRFNPQGGTLKMCQLHINVLQENLDLEKKLKEAKEGVLADMFKAGGIAGEISTRLIELQKQLQVKTAALNQCEAENSDLMKKLNLARQELEILREVDDQTESRITNFANENFGAERGATWEAPMSVGKFVELANAKYAQLEATIAVLSELLRQAQGCIHSEMCTGRAHNVACAKIDSLLKTNGAKEARDYLDKLEEITKRMVAAEGMVGKLQSDNERLLAFQKEVIENGKKLSGGPNA